MCLFDSTAVMTVRVTQYPLFSRSLRRLESERVDDTHGLLGRSQVPRLNEDPRAVPSTAAMELFNEGRLSLLSPLGAE